MSAVASLYKFRQSSNLLFSSIILLLFNFHTYYPFLVVPPSPPLKHKHIMNRLSTFFLIATALATIVLVECAPSSKPKRNKNVEEKANVFEGDIILSDDQERAIKIAVSSRDDLARVALSGIVGEKYRWEDRIVHYEISSDYAADEREIIEGAMEEIADKTCVRFEERDGEDDFLKLEDGNGCSSKVGKRGGEQTVTLSRDGCLKHGVVIHELVHAIGFWHEQSRTDRDSFVDIKWKNIQPDKYNNFKKYLRAEIYDYQVPYDYNSVMHYKGDAFKREDTDEDTIVPKDPTAEIGQREGLSELDARKINLMYCADLVKNGTTSTTESTSGGDEGEEGDNEDEENEDANDGSSGSSSLSDTNNVVADEILTSGQQRPVFIDEPSSSLTTTPPSYDDNPIEELDSIKTDKKLRN